jgi:zinc transport system ATP-binding protein
MKPVVELKEVWLRFGDKIILEDVNLILEEHDFLGIIGPNGGGKTTLLKIILGLIQPTHGDVKVFDASPYEMRKIVGYVPQIRHFDIEFPIKVGEIVKTGRLGPNKFFHRYNTEDMEIVDEALREVEMIDFKDQPISDLSGGEVQRVLIARALALKPQLLLLDEPTASIDKRLDTKLWESLNILKKKITIILVTHDISAVSIYVDKIACLNRKLFYQGTKEITAEMWEETYHCPVDMIAHGFPHRVVSDH